MVLVSLVMSTLHGISSQKKIDKSAVEFPNAIGACDHIFTSPIKLSLKEHLDCYYEMEKERSQEKTYKSSDKVLE
jgi:hypothetical protein